MMKYLLVALMALWPHFTFAQAFTLDNLAKLLTAHDSLRANFEQQRQLKGFSKPIVSQGTLLVLEKQGLIWQQNSPIKVVYVINDEQVTSQVGNNAPTIIDSKTNSQMFYFSSLLKSIMQADQKVLSDTFEITLSGDHNHWTLALVPKVSPLDKIFAHIELSGDQYVNSLILKDRQNDSTYLKFTEQHSNNITLTKDEQKLLGL